MPAERTSAIYKRRISPFLDRFDSERTQQSAKRILHTAERVPGGLRALERLGDETHSDTLKTIITPGLVLRNPVMVAAGWDKEGKVVDALDALGFSAVEVGTVPLWPQEGNPKPRQFVLRGEKGELVAVNRLGFNSPGAEAVRRNLAKYFQEKQVWQATGKDETERVKIGISLGINKTTSHEDAAEAHAAVLRTFYEGGDYFAVNVSSPNTLNLRALQEKNALTESVIACQETMDAMGGAKPLFVKVAPDLSQSALYDVIEVARTQGLAGIIATNTTINPEIKVKYGFAEAGGLSGNDEQFRGMSNRAIEFIYQHTRDIKDFTIIGVGGIKDGPTALEKIMAGANAVQILTSLRGEGPSIAGVITKFLADVVEKNGLQNISELRGKMHDFCS